MKRRIIEIDQDKCNGCGACAEACHEGAIAMVDGKAQLMRDDYCDGLGDCLPTCPTGAITFVEREAAAYDEQAVMENKQRKMRKEGMTLPCGCPGSQSRDIQREAAPTVEVPQTQQVSRLSQWPVQIKLVPVNAPYFDGARLLIAADCTAYAYAAFHERFIKGHITLVGCPKLDDVLIATDDERIADACKTYGMRYLMTSPDHDTPTGRIWEVSTVEDADLYLQLMGDEPLVNPAAFDLILPDTLPEDPCYVAVLTNIMEHPADVIDFSNQKVVTNAAREILLISRSPIPYPKGTLDFEYEKVTGIQLYSKQALAFYHATPKSILEKAEENDMMRFIENGHKVHAIVSPYKTVSVDTPKDLALVNTILKEKQHG